MTLLGEGRAPTRMHCQQLADQCGMKHDVALTIINQVNEAVQQWPQYAQQAGCSRRITQQVKKSLGVL